MEPLKANHARHLQGDFLSLSPAVWRASTVVFPSLDAFVSRKSRLYDGYTYGTTGTPTSRELERAIAALEGASHCVVAPSGQAAACLTLLALVKQGDHLLIPDAVYGPVRTFAASQLAALGLDVEFYDPSIGENIAALVRPNTRVIWLESPCTITMEMQDVPAIARVAQAHGIVTVMDNTWATPLNFAPLAHGVDIAIEAATKFFSGHSDVLLGSISTNSDALYRKLRELQSVMGQAVSAEDAFLVLRGLQTLCVRLKAQSESAMQIAMWLSDHSMVEEIYFPALPSDAGHALWARDFSGSGSLVSMVLRPATQSAASAFFDNLQSFAIGASWGGVHSLAAYYPAAEQAKRRFPRTLEPIVRLSIGLEPLETLIADLSAALTRYQSHF